MLDPFLYTGGELMDNGPCCSTFDPADRRLLVLVRKSWFYFAPPSPRWAISLDLHTPWSYILLHLYS